MAVSPLRLETPRYDGGACGGAPKKRRAPPLVHEERNVIPFPPGSSIVSRSMASASSEGFARFMMGRARESNMRPRDPSPPPSFVPFSFRSFHSSFLLTQSTPTEGSEGAEGGGDERGLTERWELVCGLRSFSPSPGPSPATRRAPRCAGVMGEMGWVGLRGWWTMNDHSHPMPCSV